MIGQRRGRAHSAARGELAVARHSLAGHVTTATQEQTGAGEMRQEQVQRGRHGGSAGGRVTVRPVLFDVAAIRAAALAAREQETSDRQEGDKDV